MIFCEGVYEDKLSAEICETKHKKHRQILYLVDLGICAKENLIQYMFLPFFSQRNESFWLWTKKSYFFLGPGKYVYANSTGSFISLETFLTQKRKELNELTLLLKNNENY